MNIEIAPKEYRIYDVSYNEAILYCFQLNIDGKIGWRLPTEEERKGIEGYCGWYLDDSLKFWREDDSSQNDAVLKSRNFWCVPVRDII
jgi:formylglycine-generating enzyme required for sulfatase activity